ncbi:hypothetical protein K503DRAFT_777682 [Rhizopogon vinicolor AM-OR11-026]|uniref:Uncharacterized protein n=1 Tax=Rhizopogon vinicolor AM-OR11-026 TaxID=1314800 RepID=A0A1B7MFF2_9AGAM|nr:hypothetical protein K503DRAFT_777682 [Rhizopogon vinicolor AM-OR11-026]
MDHRTFARFEFLSYAVSRWRLSHRWLGAMSVVGDREHPVSSHALEHSDAFSKLSGAR